MRISNVTRSSGAAFDYGRVDARGGCIKSAGNVTLPNSIVAGRDASSAGVSRGGGIYVSGQLSAKYSAIPSNTAFSNADGFGLGDGTSAGIDKSNALATNPATGNPLQYDQQGSPHARISGAVADIGAYEIDQSDTIFNSSFDGCPST